MKLGQILDFQNEDGGFPDVLAGERGFDGWTAYREPQGISNTFATFFDAPTMAMCACVLFPETKASWRFRPGIGMGYFRVEGPLSPPAKAFPAAESRS